MKPCKSCPFRDSADAYVYDADAIEALKEGNEPACHAIVGTQAIFHEAPFTPTHPCAGHNEWINGTPGYREPKLSEEN